MKTLRWNVGLAIIRIGYKLRDKLGFWKVGVAVLTVGYYLRGEVPQRHWKWLNS